MLFMVFGLSGLVFIRFIYGISNTSPDLKNITSSIYLSG